MIEEDVRKLIENGSIHKVYYPDWFLNVMIIKKKNGKNRMCIDFTDLNWACSKDPFPLPHIDILVDRTAGHDLRSFLDAFSGYNQILMHLNGQKKTAFTTVRGIYCYKIMAFGLKNAFFTYQRLVGKIFVNLIGRTMEVYIDDMIVKSKQRLGHISHLRQSFEVL